MLLSIGRSWLRHSSLLTRVLLVLWAKLRFEESKLPWTLFARNGNACGTREFGTRIVFANGMKLPRKPKRTELKSTLDIFSAYVWKRTLNLPPATPSASTKAVLSFKVIV